MSALQLYFKKTEDLVHLLQISPDRDEVLLTIESGFLEREEYLKGINPPFTQEDKELYIKIQKLEVELQALLNKEKLAIQKDIKDLSIKKQTSNKYTNPYESINQDGMFYDKRK
ncbi:flagellar protein FliT [Cytobacillus sp. FJAT-54145]|uniref:Flagellar protein FliT n=1 Tax=Cytobacillus spartinae TaxID=3299023 RepID=A0ABW6KBQ1_9BACI